MLTSAWHPRGNEDGSWFVLVTTHNQTLNRHYIISRIPTVRYTAIRAVMSL
jgi:hypothetical protein